MRFFVLVLIAIVTAVACSREPPTIGTPPVYQNITLYYTVDDIPGKVEIYAQQKRPYIVARPQMTVALRGFEIVVSGTTPWAVRTNVIVHRRRQDKPSGHCWDKDNSFVSPWYRVEPPLAGGHSGGAIVSLFHLPTHDIARGSDALLIKVESKENPDLDSSVIKESELAILQEDSARGWAYWNVSHNIFNTILGNANRDCHPMR